MIAEVAVRLGVVCSGRRYASCGVLCDMVQRRRGVRAARAHHGRQRQLLAGAGWPLLHTWHCWQTHGTFDYRWCARRIGFGEIYCVGSTASRSTSRGFRCCWLSRCFAGAEQRVAGMGSTTLVRRVAGPMMVVAARWRDAAALSVASRQAWGSAVAAEAGVRGPRFIRRGSCAAAKACSPAAGAA